MWSEDKSKIALRCGKKQILKSKCIKHHILGTLFEVLMSKKLHAAVARTHFEVKMHKHVSFGPLFDVPMSKKCTPLWRKANF